MTDDDQSQPLGTNHPPVKCSESPHRPLKIAKLSDEDDEPEAVENRTMGQNPRTFQRYLVAIEYIGTRFSGAQQQTPNCRTVVGVLQVAPISIITSSLNRLIHY